jgi:hypothetical protein
MSAMLNLVLTCFVLVGVSAAFCLLCMPLAFNATIFKTMFKNIFHREEMKKPKDENSKDEKPDVNTNETPQEPEANGQNMERSDDLEKGIPWYLRYSRLPKRLSQSESSNV